MQDKDRVDSLGLTKPVDSYRFTPRWWEVGLSVAVIFLLPLSLTLYLI